MRTTLYGVLGFTMTWIGLVAADKALLTAQAQQGREIFQHSAKVGPDLSIMAGMATVHSMVATIRITVTNTVLLVKTANGSYPAVLKQKQGDESEFWDLSETPPVLRKLTSKEIVSSDRDTKW
jgi:hypothetical protein